MRVQLIVPNKKYLKSVYEAIEEYKASPSKFEIGDVKKMIAAQQNDFADYFQNLENESLGIDLKPGYVPQTTYWLVDGDQYIGTFGFRHYLTPNLEKIGGHIAYQIRPSKYRQGYAYKGLQLCLNEAFQKGLEKVLVTCNAENLASYGVMHKVMLEYSGIEAPKVKIEGGFEKRVWLHTHKRHDKIRVLAVAVIKKNNQVLGIGGYDEIKKEKFYRLPGGGIEFGETSADALKREIKEEIGADIMLGKQIGVFENIFTYNGQKGHEIIIAYEAKLPPQYMNTDKIPMIEEEFEGCYYEFVDVTPDKLIYPKILERI